MWPDLSLPLHAAAHWILVPPGILVILLAAGLLLTPRRPVLGRTLTWAGTLLLLALSMPLVERVLTRAAGDFPPIATGSAGAAEAIVVLAAEARIAPEYGEGYSVGDLTLERLRYGTRLARQTGLPMLFSGGRVGTGKSTSLAELMQKAVVDDYGLSARWLETRSRNTRENAQFSAPILKSAGITTIVLVTDDNHMRRALKEFVAAGMHVIPAPLRVPAAHYESGWADVCPNFSAFRNSSLAIYELIGQAAQWFLPPAGPA